MDAVAELHDLERRDDELATAADRLRTVQDDVARLRARTEAIEAFLGAFDDEEARLSAEIADAERDVAERREEQARAHSDVESARSDEERELREKALARARDHVAVALSRLDREVAELEQLEADATELPAELAGLEAKARELSASSPELPPFANESLVSWASHAHAELFVALSQLNARRDRIIREANELASSVLGEPTFGSTVAQARRQVEART
jgi:cell division septum initiation protein DivIVA